MLTTDVTTDPSNRVPRPERVETDDSLRSERDKTDLELGKLTAARDQDADEVVELARVRADDLLAAAEQKAEAKIHGKDTRTGVFARLSDRATAKHTVDEERAAADEKLVVERVEHDRALSRLLASERGETDERLIIERDRSDRAVASRDDFMGIVGHDVRGILGSIAMSAELLSSLPVDGPSGGRVKSEAHRIRRLTARMNRLIGDLIDVVSMETGKLNVLVTDQDATLVLDEAMESFQLAAASLKVELRSTAPPGPHPASFDHDRILQVLTNLVGNALKFTPAGGTIEIELLPITNALQFTVRDNGCGIENDQIELMFDRFSQVTHDRRGLGLGLYIARCIIQAHGGTIWGDSKIGKGSAFHFTLPQPTRR